MMKYALGLVVGLVVVAGAPAVARAVDVTVRVEGQAKTLLPRTVVTVPAVAPLPDGINPCAAGSAGAALWAATGGQWSGVHYSFGWFINSFFGETYTFSDPESWQFWLNGTSASGGACDTPVQQGDQLLMIVARCDSYDPVTYDCTSPPVLPLALTVPATAAPGTPFSVSVKQVATDGTQTPAAGAVVSGGAATATTGASGSATVTATARGPLTLTVTQSGRVRDARTLCVTDGADGFCGTTAAPGVTPPPPDQSGVAATDTPCSTNGRDGRCGSKDTTQPWSHLTTPKHGSRFRRGRVPRTLSGTIEADGSGIAKVELRLTRRSGATCQGYSGVSERFVRLARCGAERGSWFSVGDRQDWSYLLPAALAPGRYVLDVRVTDGAGNTTKLARTYTRSVFTVA